jgi:hypothetical protein
VEIVELLEASCGKQDRSRNRLVSWSNSI